MTDDKEQYFCPNCVALVTLNVHGRCDTCSSDHVVPMAKLQTAFDALTASPKPRFLGRPIHIGPERRWFHIRFGSFETCVSPLKATCLSEALAYAKSPFCQWYLVEDVTGQECETTELNHQEFLEWCDKAVGAK